MVAKNNAMLQYYTDHLHLTPVEFNTVSRISPKKI